MDEEFVNFSSYLPAKQKNELKILCAKRRIKMQEGLSEAVGLWIAYMNQSESEVPSK